LELRALMEMGKKLVERFPLPVFDRGHEKQTRARG